MRGNTINFVSNNPGAIHFGFVKQQNGTVGFAPPHFVRTFKGRLDVPFSPFHRWMLLVHYQIPTHSVDSDPKPKRRGGLKQRFRICIHASL